MEGVVIVERGWEMGRLERDKWNEGRADRRNAALDSLITDNRVSDDYDLSHLPSFLPLYPSNEISEI